MRIAHNISGLNTYNKMNQNMKQVNQGMSKLSSGMRINKAADDAAGLAISEKNEVANTRKLLNGTNPYTSSSGGGTSSLDYSNVLKRPAVDENGSFTFGTNEGYPTTDADNNQILVYGGGSTSYPSVRIDGDSYGLKDATITPTVENNGVYETQHVSIVDDKYKIEYTIKNMGAVDRPIGFQFHMDTMLGGDDRAPFVVDGTQVDKQTAYTGSNIPTDFTVFNQDMQTEGKKA